MIELAGRQSKFIKLATLAFLILNKAMFFPLIYASPPSLTKVGINVSLSQFCYLVKL